MFQSRWLRGSLMPMFFAPLLCGQIGIGPDFLVHQEGSPLQVISISLSADSKRLDLLERVTVANIGDRPITSYTLGWVLVDDATRDKVLGPFVGRAIEARLNPGEMMLAPPQGVDYETMLRLVRGRGFSAMSLIVGVVQVLFTDGDQWNYPLMQEGQFHERRDPAIEEKLRPIRERHRRMIESLAPHQVANCGGHAFNEVSQPPVPSMLSSLYSTDGGWLRPPAMGAGQCDRCYVIVCNPWNKHCTFYNDPVYGWACGDTACIPGWARNYMRCYPIPTGCPGCGS